MAMARFLIGSLASINGPHLIEPNFISSVEIQVFPTRISTGKGDVIEKTQKRVCEQQSRRNADKSDPTERLIEQQELTPMKFIGPVPPAALE